ncbi:rhodanese-like domain-containing protein [Kineobactrum salinum]|uniref:rhodanese-like domain-containing protein n=1 Tax=Kineobactrum salinum TaxID=2708301 RepID=UPI0018D9E733|nr:rhodanese-like domain-containing protein [Kineobactrum salinum]
MREPQEYDIAHIPGSQLIPLAELRQRLEALDPAQLYVITCHRGTRSVQAWRVLQAAGFAELEVLEGGVNAWAERIDPDMARY